MAKIIIIAAIGRHLELGFKNRLIWNLKQDMDFFKQTTKGHHIVMGLKTYQSIGHALPSRVNLVLSDKPSMINDATVFYQMRDLLDYLATIDDEIYICGGASIYQQFLPLADELLLTQIDASTSLVDVYFPQVDFENYDKTVLKSGVEDQISFSINRYCRRK